MVKRETDRQKEPSGSLLALTMRGVRFLFLAIWVPLTIAVCLSSFSETPRRLFFCPPLGAQYRLPALALSFSQYSLSVSINDGETPKSLFGFATTVHTPEGIPSSWDHQPIEFFLWPVQRLAYLAIRSDAFIVGSIFLIGVCYRKSLAKWLLRKPIVELE